ncbi:hypothetical protein K523DRAFT_218971, partial [Schizophyllum commune Tattone D]
PDISIIENLWAYIDKRVRSRIPAPATPDEWWEAVQEEWAKIPIEYITALYESIPDRLDKLKEARGYWTKY